MPEAMSETANETADEAARQAPSKAPSLHEKVLDQLRDYIIEGNVEENARIPEPKLCELFQISRTPLREALKVLAAEGLVELLPNRGARLRALLDSDGAVRTTRRFPSRPSVLRDCVVRRNGSNGVRGRAR